MQHEFKSHPAIPHLCAVYVKGRGICGFPASTDIHMPDTAKDAQEAAGAQEMAVDGVEMAFQSAMAEWDGKSKRDQRILSPRRHFFEAGYAVSVPALKAENKRLRELVARLCRNLDEHIIVTRRAADQLSSNVRPMKQAEQAIIDAREELQEAQRQAF